MLSEQLINSLNNSLNQTLDIQNIAPVAGGDIHQVWLLTTAQTQWFLKVNRVSSAPVFAAEALALERIQQSKTIHCPSVIAQGETDQQAWLLMDYLQLTHRGDDFKRGQALAAIHRTTHREFGWEQDNFIGHTPQRNAWQQDWLDFYRQQRLEPQLALTLQKGASRRLLAKGQQLTENLAVFFEHYKPVPSLLHGDLWAGNSAFTVQGEPVIYDPASYYGDRETDIAMTELFGGFSPAFYQGYNQAWPLDAGYQQRKPLYNLYHVLNHFNLFGGHYQHQAEQLIDDLLSQL
ncbi:fructosamine kinase family protein [Thiomicrospira cyclica]|uniref:Fructosamine/Ketosamine-3-kinase n=1 Tax=Thiomicrospira cyclica (strain DSM 14477 / JCM 11371 / ALM1) TaxID=717773 RepID=F6D8Y9_THICA|nr:fructosamine kinase family protein [Thiomicrospira cyclica]AEG31989.1 Fructosamine/Ketosamine-3-kinase [Thiomicrospira cyclica ALM1]